MHVETDHLVQAIGFHRMILTEFTGGPAIAAADRTANGWNVYAPGEGGYPSDPGGPATTRHDAIDAMINLTLRLLPEEGFSTLVPNVHVGETRVSLREVP